MSKEKLDNHEVINRKIVDEADILDCMTVAFSILHNYNNNGSGSNRMGVGSIPHFGSNHEFALWLGYDGVRDLQSDKGVSFFLDLAIPENKVTREPPTSHEVSFMNKTISWPMDWLYEDDLLKERDAFNIYCFSRASNRPISSILKPRYEKAVRIALLNQGNYALQLNEKRNILFKECQEVLNRRLANIKQSETVELLQAKAQSVFEAKYEKLGLHLDEYTPEMAMPERCIKKTQVVYAAKKAAQTILRRMDQKKQRKIS